MNEEGKSIREELLVGGKELMATIRDLVHKGNVRSVVLRNEEGKQLLEISLNTGLALGGAAVLLAPFLAAIAGIAAMAKKVRIEIIRNDDDKTA